MTLDKNQRQPASFSVPDTTTPAPTVQTAPRKPAHFDDAFILTDEMQDPFLAEQAAATVTDLPPPRPRLALWPWIVSGFGLVFSLAFGLWVDSLIRDLFTRADWLGYLALGGLAVGLLALVAFVLREMLAIRRMANVQAFKREAEAVTRKTKPAVARTLIANVASSLAHRAETARGRALLDKTEGEIIDAPQLLELAERHLLMPLDDQARALVLNAAKRVSVVTAVSPRAIVDLAYVIYESARLVRAVAELYGGRPGSLGFLRLFRDTIAHLAVTSSIAVGDSLFQQFLGHGLATKLSARLGEGVINGLMTARIGIAAIDLCRPLPFKTARRPGISDFARDLVPGFGDNKAK